MENIQGEQCLRVHFIFCGNVPHTKCESDFNAFKKKIIFQDIFKVRKSNRFSLLVVLKKYEILSSFGHYGPFEQPQIPDTGVIDMYTRQTHLHTHLRSL